MATSGVDVEVNKARGKQTSTRLLIGQLVIALVCQLVLAMSHAVWRQPRNATIVTHTADWSCELNVCQARVYLANLFP